MGPEDSGTPGETDAGVADGGTLVCPANPLETTLTSLLDPGSPTAGSPGTSVRIKGAVVTSPRFLVSRNVGTGTCTIGVFVADANAAAVPYGGVLLVRTTPGVIPDGGGGGFDCPLQSDVFPADLAPGDLVNVEGRYEPFGPNTAQCSSSPMPAKAAQVLVACPIERTGTGTVPTPAAVTPNDLLSGSSSLAGWSGGLVRVTNVQAKTATAPGDSTFGTFTLDPSGLAVGSKLYARTSSAPTIAVGQKFNAIVGLPSLELCTWTLQPRGPCDFDPPLSGSCP